MGLVAAALFGIATPLSKGLLRDLSPFALAGLLYLGAAAGVLPYVLIKRQRARRIDRRNVVRLSGAVLFGGCLGPVFLLMGLASARASSVSLWLNLELAATAVLGLLFFKDHLDRNGWLGVGGALLAGVLVTVNEGVSGVLPAVFVACACLCWGVDNNLTAVVDGVTPQGITFIKGAIAGAVNLVIGLSMHPRLPGASTVLSALGVGALCYGGSIVLYITAAQGLGAIRGQILFASAPFFGMLFSILLLSEKTTWAQWAAAAIMVAAIALMHRERHAHAHVHERIVHVHAHRHDDLHHDHDHDHGHGHGGKPAAKWHIHWHQHTAIEHAHPHVPDLHHRHGHAAR
jgi:drug/metabolite transporter (DMT)-like permease